MSLEQISSAEKATTAIPNPELDRMKAELTAALALREMKAKPGKGGEVADHLREKGLKGLQKDLDELGITDTIERKKYEDEYRNRFQETTAGLQGEAVSTSMEANKLDSFVGGYARSSGLDAVIAEHTEKTSGAPRTPFKRFIKAHPELVASVSAALLTWLADEKKEETPTNIPAAGAVSTEAEVTPMAGACDTGADGNQAAEGKNFGETGTGGRDTETPSGSVFGGGYVEKNGGVKYDLDNPKYSEKLSAAEFIAAYRSLRTNRQARYGLILKQIAAGNAQVIFKDMKVKAADGTEVTMKVSTNGVQIAGVPVQLDGPTAEAAMKLMGCTLPTDWVAEERWKAAKAAGGAIPFIAAPEIAHSMGLPWNANNPDGPTMMSAEFALKRAKLLDKWRKYHGISEDQLVDGHFKYIVHPVPGVTAPGHLAFTGGRDLNGANIQGPLGEGAHEKEYSDYSHEAVAVKNGKDSVAVTEIGADGKPVMGPDGKPVIKKMSASEFYASPVYAKKFGFKVIPLNQSYTATKELQTFVDQHKSKEDTPKPVTPAPTATPIPPNGKPI